MSPRPRTQTDGQILAGALDVLGTVGPARLTLAEVARHVGLSPATLLQRFGSKRGLLLALTGYGEEEAREEFARARTEHGNGIEALLIALASMTRFARTPEALSHHLAFLQLDLTDGEFHERALTHALAVLAEIRSCLEAACGAGELERCDTERLARTLQVTYNGALTTWAIYREGSVHSYVRDDLEAVLSPYRRPLPTSM